VSASPPHRSAFVCVIGRPNSGKSTLINAVLGDELSIATAMPQTTRKNIRGIYTTDGLQIVFVDTPGIHHGRHMYNKTISQESETMMQEKGVDVICYVVDLSRGFGAEEDRVAALAGASTAAVLVVFNKQDMVDDALSLKETFFARYPALQGARSVIVSALSTGAPEAFLQQLHPLIPEGPRFFPDDQLSDENLRFFAAEFIRKSIIRHTKQEVPHASFVEIEQYREEENTHHIQAKIHVETQGQKGILIGKNGACISAIKSHARHDIKKLTGASVKLSLHVSISKHWRNNPHFLQRAGYALR
jgi:GTP-binding protein Era